LYDLTFVVAFGVAADELAHYVAEGHLGAGLAGFGFAVFAVAWAWMNYSWWASAYDTDDWLVRLATMVQMVGVIILALGLDEMFASIDHGTTMDNGVMVIGYVVMRVSMISLWLLAARHDPSRRRATLTYAVLVGAAQVGWVGLTLLGLSTPRFFVVGGALMLVELSGPLIAERWGGGTPWHPHHIAERHGLLVIITLGEGVIGTVASLNAVVHGQQGWSADAALLAVAGIGLTFGLWWMYFAVPWAAVLEYHRVRALPWGLGHFLIVGSLAAVGAGLHVAAYHLEGRTMIGPASVVLSVVGPVAVFAVAYYGTYSVFMRHRDPFHLLLLAGTAVVLAAALVLAAAGVSVSWSLVVLMLAPTVTVIGYETVGHRHLEAAVVAQLGDPTIGR
jgi:low temperature requirement protein LtrA